VFLNLLAHASGKSELQHLYRKKEMIEGGDRAGQKEIVR